MLHNQQWCLVRDLLTKVTIKEKKLNLSIRTSEFPIIIFWKEKNLYPLFVNFVHNTCLLIKWIHLLKCFFIYSRNHVKLFQFYFPFVIYIGKF